MLLTSFYCYPPSFLKSGNSQRDRKGHGWHPCNCDCCLIPASFRISKVLIFAGTGGSRSPSSQLSSLFWGFGFVSHLKMPIVKGMGGQGCRPRCHGRRFSVSASLPISNVPTVIRMRWEEVAIPATVIVLEFQGWFRISNVPASTGIGPDCARGCGAEPKKRMGTKP